MKRRSNQVDLTKMLLYILAHLWLVVLFAELGFAARYLYTTRRLPETYTSSGTMYVNNGNPNLSDYQYTSANDLNSAVQLIKTYLVVVRSDKVMSAVTERLVDNHPGITAAAVSASVSMESVSETGVVAVKSTTNDPKLSADIVNAVMEIAPDEIIRVVGAGNVEILDYATVPILPNARNAVMIGLRYGASIGAAIAAAILAILYLLNQKITSAQDLKDNYELPILASIKRIDVSNPKADSYMLSNKSAMEIVENYAKLRMNLFYTLVGKGKNAVVVTSSISGEGKSTITSNLAISCAMSGKKVLLVDGDMRRASQMDIFQYGDQKQGLSDILVGLCRWQDVILHDIRENVDLLPAGHIPPNPAELLDSDGMRNLILELEQVYDLVLLDMPPINIVSDPLVVSSSVAGCLFVVRQNFTDQRDVKKALNAAEMTGMHVLGFVFYGERLHEGSYYSRRYYKSYYNKYDYRRHPAKTAEQNVVQDVKRPADQNAKQLTEQNAKQIAEQPAEQNVTQIAEQAAQQNAKQMIGQPAENGQIKENLAANPGAETLAPVSAPAAPVQSAQTVEQIQMESAKAVVVGPAADSSAAPAPAVEFSPNQTQAAQRVNAPVSTLASTISTVTDLRTNLRSDSGDQQKRNTSSPVSTSTSHASASVGRKTVTAEAGKASSAEKASGTPRKDASEAARSAVRNMRHSLQAFVKTRTKKTDDKNNGTEK